MENYTRKVSEPPHEQVTNGRCNMGTFNGPIILINPLDTEKPLGFSVPRFMKYLRLKEWEAFQIANEDWFICLAVYNSKAVGVAIVMAYNKNEDRMYHYEKKVPFWQLNVPRGLHNSHCYYHSRNFNIDIYNKLQENRAVVEFNMRNFKKLPDCKAAFTGFHETEPIVIVQPFAENRPLYSHKALMPAEGSLTMGNTKTQFARTSSAMVIDDHKGYYPYVMKYDWVTTLGYDTDGRLAGFNLTDNQIQNHEKYNENCLWLDGKMHPLPPIKVNRPSGVMHTWEIQDNYGRVKLFFTPLKDVPVYLNLLIIASRYHGPIGGFEGYIVNSDGEKISFDGFVGMGEQKYIRM
jgi:Domain of unknown function (DUF2804), C-terminal/Domain of unknown function (DUF2804), N-terminal